jgi:hypothetical protein
MTRKVIALVTFTVLFLSAMALFAHDQYRIVGVITGMQASQLTVKDKDGKTFSMKVDDATYIHRDKYKAKIAVTELKAGRSVVVDALGDSEKDLFAVEVRIVPAIAAPAGKKE